ncbi:hypothetical protein D3C78_1457080 [compost metagenome]
MALDVEETPLAAGEVDLFGDSLPGDLVGAVERGDVDDGELIHAQSLRTLKIQCGSGLARENGVSGDICID